jgi:hypothetical protein
VSTINGNHKTAGVKISGEKLRRPICFLRRFEGVSEPSGEREPSAEILSVAKDPYERI